MNKCKGDKKCLNLCICECYDDDTLEYSKICVCGHRNHNGICIYVHCKCNCNIYDINIGEYIEMECKCGHKEHNGKCYLAEPPCCEPIKCLNYLICKWICLDKTHMPNFPFCIDCNCDMGSFTNTNIIKECEICNENKNILLLECNHEICGECLVLIAKIAEKNNNVYCPFCYYNDN